MANLFDVAPGAISKHTVTVWGARCGYCGHEVEHVDEHMTLATAFAKKLRDAGWQKLKTVGWVCCNRPDLIPPPAEPAEPGGEL